MKTAHLGWIRSLRIEILILLVGFVSIPIKEVFSKEVKNNSGIEIVTLPKLPNKYGTEKPNGGKLCKADSPKWAGLTGIPRANERFKIGIACLPADFDGNGFLDFALLDKGWHEDETAVGTTEVFVLFFGQDGWIKTEKLSSKVGIFPFGLYGPTAKRGEFGEPISPRPGLVQSGEGGSTYIFLYSPKSKKFRVTEHASEHH